MSDLNQAVRTDDIVNAIMNSVTIESLSALTAELATLASSSDTALDTKITNEVIRLDALVATATEAADRLDAYEKQQIEEILNNLVSQDGFQQLLQTVSVNINGSAKSLESVIDAIVAANNHVVKTTLLSDASGAYNGAQLTLASGEVGMLSLVTTTEGTGDTLANVYTFSSSDWAGSGLTAEFYIKTQDVVKSFTMFGQTSDIKVGEKVLEQTNIVFDLTGILVDAAAATTVNVPDIDGDGNIGVQ